MTNLEKYVRAKKDVDELQSEVDRLRGALEQETARLKREFKCSKEQAVKLLAELQSRSEEAEAAYAKSLDRFEKDWDKILAGHSTTTPAS